MRTAAEHLSPNDPLTKKIAFARQAVLNDICQEDLALAAAPEGCAVKDVAESFPNMNGVAVRYGGTRICRPVFQVDPQVLYSLSHRVHPIVSLRYHTVKHLVKVIQNRI